MVGVAMFGSTVYLSQYFQIARGMSPTHAGLMSIAMVGGLLVSSIVTGRIITSTGLWKRYLVGGMVLVIVGLLLLLGTIDETTPPGRTSAPSWRCSASGSARPCRTSCSPSRTTPLRATWVPRARSSRSSARWAARSASRALGAVLSQPGRGHRDGRARRRWASPCTRTAATTIPDLATLPAPIRAVFEAAFGEATGHLFLIAVPFAVVALLCVLFIKEVPLRTTIEREDEAVTEPARRAGHRGRPAVTAGKEQLLNQLEAEMATLIRRIRRVITERAREVHEELQPAAYLILANLVEHGPKRASALVEEFGIDKGAISRQVQQLVDLGLVERTPDPADGRAMMLGVTDEGRSRLTDTSRQRRKLLDERLSGWSDDELAVFVTALGRYNRTLDA